MSPLKGKRSIIFDFDLTLADSSRGAELTINSALKRMGRRPHSYKAISTTIGLSLDATYVRLGGDQNAEEIAIFKRFFKEEADRYMTANTSLYPDVPSTLSYLHQHNYNLAIVSTKFRYRIEQILERESIRHFFSVIIGGEDVAAVKPEPEGLFAAIGTIGAEVFETVYIGDSTVDAEVAKRARVDFVAVLTGTTSHNDFEKYHPKAILNHLSELTTVPTIEQ